MECKELLCLELSLSSELALGVRERDIRGFDSFIGIVILLNGMTIGYPAGQDTGKKKGRRCFNAACRAMLRSSHA